MLSRGYFEIVALKTLENILKNVGNGVSFNKIVRLHSTAYYRIENTTIDTFLEVLRKEKKLNSNIFRKRVLFL